MTFVAFSFLWRGSEGQIDPASLLTMASMRVSLSLLKTLRDSNPAIFTNMCESLMALFEVGPHRCWHDAPPNCSGCSSPLVPRDKRGVAA